MYGQVASCVLLFLFSPEEFVSEVEKGKQIPLKTSQTQGTLLVSGLPKEVTEDELKSIFTEAVGIFIARDDSRKPKG